MVLELVSPPSDLDRIGFQLGWDYGHHGLAPAAPALSLAAARASAGAGSSVHGCHDASTAHAGVAGQRRPGRPFAPDDHPSCTLLPLPADCRLLLSFHSCRLPPASPFVNG